jgi:hypothetical protein
MSAAALNSAREATGIASCVPPTQPAPSGKPGKRQAHPAKADPNAKCRGIDLSQGRDPLIDA